MAHHTESEALLYRILIENSGNALFIHDFDGSLIDVNQSACERLGYTREELLNMTVADIEQKIDLDRARAEWSNLKPDVPVVLVGKHKRKDGTVFPVEIVVGYTMVNGKKHLMSLVRNITDEAHAEYKFKKMVEAAPDPIFIQTEETFAYLNPAGCQLFGIDSPEELIGTPVLDHIHEDNREVVEERIRLLNTRQKLPIDLYEQRMLRMDGETVWVETKAEPIAYEVKQGALVFVRDISQRKRTEADLRESNRLLEKTMRRAETLNEAKSQFLANMSHELRTPLNGFMGMLQLLLTTELSEEQREYVEFSVKSCLALTGVVNDILNWTDLEKKRQERIDELFNPGILLHEVADLHEVTARYKNLDLHLEIDPSLPDQLVGERYKFKQILNNLVGNAVKFTEEGSVHMSIKSKPAQDLRKICLECQIRDTGIGIPEDKINFIFDRFVQADSSTTRTYGGVGLGLAAAKELADQMDGTLSVESSPGKGSCFTFMCEMERSEDEAHSPFNKSMGGRVLVVDDDFAGRRVADYLLGYLGFQVDMAASGEEAVNKFKQQNYDLILMDCKMQVVNGFETTNRIRFIEKESGRHTPIVAMTAKALAGDREECINSGMDGYMDKPLELKRLGEVIQMYLGEDDRHLST